MGASVTADAKRGLQGMSLAFAAARCKGAILCAASSGPRGDELWLLLSRGSLVTARLKFALWQHGDAQCKRNPGGWANNIWSSAPTPSGHANINLNNGNANDKPDANALAMSGWRLLSDELALIDPDTLALTPFVRPVSLKNASIKVIAERYPESVFTPSVRDTVKGTVAHMRAPQESIKAGRQMAQARWLIFPKFVPGAAWHLTPLPKAMAMTELASNVFNFRGLGMLAFETLSRLVDSVDCFQLEYSSLADAEEQLAILADQE
mgnify:CR=1 FL=1